MMLQHLYRWESGDFGMVNPVRQLAAVFSSSRLVHVVAHTEESLEEYQFLARTLSPDMSYFTEEDISRVLAFMYYVVDRASYQVLHQQGGQELVDFSSEALLVLGQFKRDFYQAQQEALCRAAERAMQADMD